jgi:rubredoxin
MSAVEWECSKCGFFIRDEETPSKCGACGNKRGFIQVSWQTKAEKPKKRPPKKKKKKKK